MEESEDDEEEEESLVSKMNCLAAGK